MKQTKRSLALVLAIVSLLLLCCTAALAEGASNIVDNEGPFIENPHFTDPTTAAADDTVVFSATIWDYSGVYNEGDTKFEGFEKQPFITVKYVPTSAKDTQTLYLDMQLTKVDNTTYSLTKAEFNKYVTSLNAVYTIQSITARDKYGNKSVYTLDPAKENFTWTVKDSYDCKDPVVHNFSCQQEGQSVLSTDLITFDINIEAFHYTDANGYDVEEPSNSINEITFYFQSESYKCDSSIVDVHGYKLDYPITFSGEYFPKGTYYVTIKVTDKYGRVGVSNAKQICSFTIVGDGERYNTASISDVKLVTAGKQYQDGETVDLYATVEPKDGFEIENVYAYFFAADDITSVTDYDDIQHMLYKKPITLKHDHGNVYHAAIKLDKTQIVDGAYYLYAIQVELRNDNSDLDTTEYLYCTDMNLWFDFADKRVAPEALEIFPKEVALSTDGINPNTQALSVIFTPVETTDTRLIWTSSNPDIAKVDDKGLVTAVASGTAYITATSYLDSTMKDVCRVVVNDASDRVESITLDVTGPVALVFNAETEYPSQQVNATVKPETASQKVVWFSDDPTVATISDTGLIEAVGNGTTKIYAVSTDGYDFVSDKITVTVSTVAVKALKLQSTASLLITPFDPTPTAELELTVLPKNAYRGNLVWESSDTTVATVKDGIVTAVAFGEATITCSLPDGTLKTSCELIVDEKIIATDVILNTEKCELWICRETPIPTAKLEATVLPEDATIKTVKWTSSNEDVAIVNSFGVVTAIKEGVAYITAESEDPEHGLLAFATCQVIVYKSYTTAITLDKTGTLDLSITYEEPNPTVTIKATVSPVTAKNELQWISEDSDVVTVKNGVVTAVGCGTTQVYAKAMDGTDVTSEKVTITVSLVHVEKVDIERSTIDMEITSSDPNPSIALNYRILPENAYDQTLIWTSSDTKIVTVKDGIITARGIGSAVITAVSNDNETVFDTCVVNVLGNPIVTAVTLNTHKITLRITPASKRPAKKLTATITPLFAEIKTISWYSSNEKVAKVNDHGRVVAVGAGTCEIVVHSKDPDSVAYDVCKVTVTKSNVTSVAFSKKQLTITRTADDPKPTRDITKYVTVSPAKASYKLSWSTSDKKVATVKNGVVTAIGKGVCHVTVAVKDASLSAKIKIVVK